jgi:hypothetical protein
VDPAFEYFTFIPLMYSSCPQVRKVPDAAGPLKLDVSFVPQSNSWQYVTYTSFRPFISNQELEVVRMPQARYSAEAVNSKFVWGSKTGDSTELQPRIPFIFNNNFDIIL